MTLALGLILFVVGLVVGEQLPDVDQSTDLLLHRSIILHSPLVPVLLFMVATESRSVPLRRFAIGVSLGFAVHLAFDLFPRGWSGYALISLPVYGWTPAAFSKVWIALSTIVCAYLAAKLARGCLEAILFVIGVIGVFISAMPDEHTLWRPAGAIIVACGMAIVLTLPGRTRAGAW